MSRVPRVIVSLMLLVPFCAAAFAWPDPPGGEEGSTWIITTNFSQTHSKFAAVGATGNAAVADYFYDLTVERYSDSVVLQSVGGVKSDTATPQPHWGATLPVPGASWQLCVANVCIYVDGIIEDAKQITFVQPF